MGAMADEEYTKKNCEIIIQNREYTVCELKKLGFTMTPSTANFVFAKHKDVSGKTPCDFGHIMHNVKEIGRSGTAF